eukprot:891285_1
MATNETDYKDACQKLSQLLQIKQQQCDTLEHTADTYKQAVIQLEQTMQTNEKTITSQTQTITQLQNNLTKLMEAYNITKQSAEAVLEINSALELKLKAQNESNQNKKK